MDKKLLSLLVCPLCKGQVHLERERQELVCRADGIAFPIDDGIPVMLVERARKLSVEEKLDKT